MFEFTKLNWQIIFDDFEKEIKYNLGFTHEEWSRWLAIFKNSFLASYVRSDRKYSDFIKKLKTSGSHFEYLQRFFKTSQSRQNWIYEEDTMFLSTLDKDGVYSREFVGKTSQQEITDVINSIEKSKEASRHKFKKYYEKVKSLRKTKGKATTSR